MKMMLERTVAALFAIGLVNCSGGYDAGSSSDLRSEEVRAAQSAVTGVCYEVPGVPYQPMQSETGTFQFAFDAIPSASKLNGVFGLSNGAQTSDTSFAALVRFNSSGYIDALSGGSFKAASKIPYSAGVTYHFVLNVDISAHKYSAVVTPMGSDGGAGTEQIVGTGLSFGSGASSVTSINTWGGNVPVGGSIDVCNPTPASEGDFSMSLASTTAIVYQGEDLDSQDYNYYQATVTAIGGFHDSVTLSLYGAPTGVIVHPDPPVIGSGTLNVNVEAGINTPPGTYHLTLKAKSGSTAITHSASVTLIVDAGDACATATPTDGWTNTSVAGGIIQGVEEWAFDAMPTASPTNSLIGISKGPQTASTGFGSLVRFNSSGTIDALNGSTYEATQTFKYKANTTYHFIYAVNVNAHTYSILVYPPGGNQGNATTIASNFAFQTSESSVTSLDNWGVEMNSTAAGDTKVCNFRFW
jgi:hypothetical protein